MPLYKGFEAKQIRHEKTKRLPYGLDYRTFPRLYKFSNSPPFCRKFFTSVVKATEAHYHFVGNRVRHIHTAAKSVAYCSGIFLPANETNPRCQTDEKDLQQRIWGI